MIAINELRLPIDHPPEALEIGILKRLEIPLTDLIRFEVFKRSHDARKNMALTFSYTLHISVRDEAAVLAKWAHDQHIRPAPDIKYKPVTKACGVKKLQPVVIGFGPCGIFAALILAQSGFKPIVL